MHSHIPTSSLGRHHLSEHIILFSPDLSSLTLRVCCSQREGIWLQAEKTIFQYPRVYVYYFFQSIFACPPPSFQSQFFCCTFLHFHFLMMTSGRDISQNISACISRCRFPNRLKRVGGGSCMLPPSYIRKKITRSFYFQKVGD